MTLLPPGYTRRDITTPDGRVVEVLLTGPEDGGALVLHHGTPGAAAPFPVFDAGAAAAGFQVISYSRPGYGVSTESFRQRVADAAADVRTILDEVGAYRFVTAGMAGGGPYALACGALIPDRCAGVAAVSCAAPFDAKELDWFADMSEERVEALELGIRDPTLCEKRLESRVDAFLGVASADELVEAIGGSLVDADRRAIREGHAEAMIPALQRAFLGGTAGWQADDVALTSPWGFSVEEVRVPVRLWHGAADRVVPAGHGRWLADRIPQSGCQIVLGEGHFSLPPAVAGAVVEALAAYASCSPG